MFQDGIEGASDLSSVLNKDFSDTPAKHLRRSPSKEPLRALVPVENTTIHVLDEDRVLGFVEQFGLFAQTSVSGLQFAARQNSFSN